MSETTTTSKRAVIESIEGEYRRYRQLAEKTFEQLSASQLMVTTGEGNNSIAIIAWHVAGNLKSRFTDFLTSDGEKPWRDRDSEFLTRDVSRDELLAFWDAGWATLVDTLAGLTDEHLHHTITIRGQAMSAIEALHRSLSHVAYHVGQIVLLGRQMRGADWTFLSVAPGKTAEYNLNPISERPPR